MKLLLLDRDFHHKNRAALYAYKHIRITPFYSPDELKNHNLDNYDAVYSPTYPIDVSMYPATTRFIFGPHFSVFPEHNLRTIYGPNTIYIQPSKWAADVWKVHPLCKDLLTIRPIPFGVDTDLFEEIRPIRERTEVFVYYKTRNPDDLAFIDNKMRELDISYRLFSYDHRYNEADYKNCLQNAKYGIWVGRHESQGFALEEALSCNVPLLVWDVLSMNQEYGPNYDDIPATAIPYWDSRCGEVFYKREHFDYTYQVFMSKLYEFNPREYIVSQLSIEKCESRFIDLMKPI
jgi:hypothetical protein